MGTLRSFLGLSGQARLLKKDDPDLYDMFAGRVSVNGVLEKLSTPNQKRSRDEMTVNITIDAIARATGVKHFWLADDFTYEITVTPIDQILTLHVDGKRVEMSLVPHPRPTTATSAVARQIPQRRQPMRYQAVLSLNVEAESREAAIEYMTAMIRWYGEQVEPEDFTDVVAAMPEDDIDEAASLSFWAGTGESTILDGVYKTVSTFGSDDFARSL